MQESCRLVNTFTTLNVFFSERKAEFGKLMKNVRDAGFSRKRGGNAGSGSPLPDPVLRDRDQVKDVLSKRRSVDVYLYGMPLSLFIQ